jgi:preprotein translocase subunit SecD
VRRLAVLLVLFALAGCTSERVGPERTPPPSPPAPTAASASGPIDLRLPLELAPVVTAGQPSATMAPDPEGAQLALAAPFLTITRLENASLARAEYDNSWTIVIRLTEPDARSFGQWTSEHIGERLAVVVNGRVVFAPEIQAAITTGDVVITSQYTEREARDLLAQITG